MNRIKRIFSYIHLSSWLLGFLLLCWIFRSEGHSNWLYLSGNIVLICLSVFYSHFFVLTRYGNRKKLVIYLLSLLIILLAGPLPFILIEGRDISTWPHFLDQYFTTLFSIVIICVILSGLARATESWFVNAFKRERLEKQAVQEELSYLKWQINPHFLFNTLNNIHTLAYKQAPSTPEAIMRLSSLMRYMLYESNANTVVLKREIDYLHDFISLQQLRYKKDPVVDMLITGDTGACYIAPLLFIHLLENAYKHSPALLEPSDIKIRIVIEEEDLTFLVQNPVAINKVPALDQAGGIGLANLRKRLQLLYPDRHNFEIDRRGALFTVTLEIHHIHLLDHERKADLLYRG